MAASACWWAPPQPSRGPGKGIRADTASQHDLSPFYVSYPDLPFIHPRHTLSSRFLRNHSPSGILDLHPTYGHHLPSLQLFIISASCTHT